MTLLARFCRDCIVSVLNSAYILKSCWFLYSSEWLSSISELIIDCMCLRKKCAALFRASAFCSSSVASLVKSISLWSGFTYCKVNKSYLSVSHSKSPRMTDKIGISVTFESPLQVITRRALTSLKPGFCASSHKRRNQVSVTLHTQTLPPSVTDQTVTGPGPGPCDPPCCSTAGTTRVPLHTWIPAHIFLCAYLWRRDQSMRHEHSDGWQDREVYLIDI